MVRYTAVHKEAEPAAQKESIVKSVKKYHSLKRIAGEKSAKQNKVEQKKKKC